MINALKNVHLYLLIFFGVVSQSAIAMEAPKREDSRVMSLQTFALIQLSQEEDLEKLRANISSLSNDIAFSLLTNVLSFNYSIGVFAKCELVAKFRKRDGLSKPLQQLLASYEYNLLHRNSIGARAELEINALDEELSDELSFVLEDSVQSHEEQ